MHLPASQALWFLPFVLPICFYVAWSDMRAMKITNPSVVALFVVFAVLGLIAIPFEDYIWRYLHVVVVLVAGMVLNAGGVMGAGDAKFLAAASPMVVVQDIPHISLIFAATLLAAWLTHRAAKYSFVRELVPDWESWHRGRDFPMGLALGGTLAIYLVLAAFGSR
jgi:prepilin peptidase CpaA